MSGIFLLFDPGRGRRLTAGCPGLSRSGNYAHPGIAASGSGNKSRGDPLEGVVAFRQIQPLRQNRVGRKLRKLGLERRVVNAFWACLEKVDTNSGGFDVF